jgi:AcrR family transcriptional regulator
MRTAQTHSPTKEKLLEAAQQLMLAKGFPATTVDEICSQETKIRRNENGER